jgi:NAD(P)H-hydrate repair Nnr-like enzyme with NAD(P)H-hydrate epimerase domain
MSRWLAMASVKPKRSMVKEVNAKASAGTCLICGKPANSSRGLCVAHYLKFARTMATIPKNRRAAFEQVQIEAGKILASGAIREIKTPNPFSTEDSDE